MCQTSGAIYSISCPIKNCNKKYFGSSKRKIKERIGEHIEEAAKLLEPNPKSKDSFTRHLKDDHGDDFFDMVYNWVVNNNWGEKEDQGIGRNILWQFFEANLVKKPSMRFVGTLNCTLCAAERSIIWLNMRNGVAMNQNNDWHGFCRHKGKDRVTNLIYR